MFEFCKYCVLLTKNINILWFQEKNISGVFRINLLNFDSLIKEKVLIKKKFNIKTLLFFDIIKLTLIKIHYIL